MTRLNLDLKRIRKYFFLNIIISSPISRLFLLSLSLFLSSLAFEKKLFIILNALFIGNCLKLAANGILNQFPCTNTFYDCCPENHNFSDTIFNCKYPLQRQYFSYFSKDESRLTRVYI